MFGILLIVPIQFSVPAMLERSGIYGLSHPGSGPVAGMVFMISISFHKLNGTF